MNRGTFCVWTPHAKRDQTKTHWPIFLIVILFLFILRKKFEYSKHTKQDYPLYGWYAVYVHRSSLLRSIVYNAMDYYIMSINILTERLYVICLEHWLLIVLFGLEILIFSPDGVPSSTKYKILGSMTRKHMYVSENEHKHASTPFWLK